MAWKETTGVFHFFSAGKVYSCTVIRQTDEEEVLPFKFSSTSDIFVFSWKTRGNGANTFFLTFFSFETAVNVICQLVKVSSRADKRHNSDSYNIAVRKAFDAVAGRELRLRHIHINISLTWETVGLSLLVKENLNLDDFIVT